MGGWHNGTDSDSVDTPSNPGREPHTGGASDPKNTDWGVKFDGEKVTITKNGYPTNKSFPAASGAPGWQNPSNQSVPNKGPIPEGTYTMDTDEIQSIEDRSFWDAVKGFFGGGKWPGGKSSWGEERAWVDPINGTNTYNRGGFSIHGGSSFGSAGCIDLEKHVKDFMDAARGTGQKEMSVDVDYGFPLILDLDGDGVETISARDSNAFFNYGNGEAKADGTNQEYVVRTGWVGADDGILVYDFDDSGTVNDPFEIVFTKYLQGAKTDLEGLRGLDDNKDGKLDDKDKAWAKFKIWQDKNQNGITESNEMVNLASLGIAFINLTGDGKASVQNGNLIAQHAEYGTIDGQTHQLGDVGFGFELQLYERGQVKDAGLSSGNQISGQVEVHVTDSIINTSPKLDEVHSPVIYQDGVFGSAPTPSGSYGTTSPNQVGGGQGSSSSISPQASGVGGAATSAGANIENGPLISQNPGVQVQGPKEVIVFQPGAGSAQGDPRVEPGDDNNGGNSTPPQDYRLPASASNDVMEGIEDQTLSFSADDLLKNDRTDYGHLEIIGIDHVKGGRVEWIASSNSATSSASFLIGPQASGRPTNSNLGVPSTPGPTHLGASGEGAEQATPTGPSGATSHASEGGESGHYVFIPDEDFEGEASFDYWIKDEAGNVSQATAKIDIKGVNDDPIAKEAIYVGMKEDATKSFTLDQLLKPILDKDGDVLSLGKIMNVTGGKLEWVSVTAGTSPQASGGGGAATSLGANQIGGGHYIFTGAKDYNGIGGFAYEVSDGKGGTVIQYVTINIEAVNDLPSMVSQPKTIEEDHHLNFSESDLLQGASDADGDVLSITGISNVKGGRVELVTPSAGTSPQASGDASAQGALQFDYAGKASGAATSAGANKEGGGQYIFIAAKDFNGEAGFDYQISDGKGGVITIHQQIDVQSVNDAPEAIHILKATMKEDGILLLKSNQLLGSVHDVDGDKLSLGAISNVAHGTVTINAKGNYQFIAESDFNGIGGFDYEVSDGKGGIITNHVEITISPANDAPIIPGQAIDIEEDGIWAFSESQLLQGALDADGDVLSVAGISNVTGGTIKWVSDVTAGISSQASGVGGAATSLGANQEKGRYIFEAAADYHGEGGFDYEVSDGKGGVQIAHVTLNIIEVNDAPVAEGEEWQMKEDGNVAFTLSDLLTNDKDVDGDGLSVSGMMNVKGGILQQQADGSYLFQADKDFNGIGGFDYEIDDGRGGVTVGHVDIQIEAVNDAPVVSGMATEMEEDGIWSFASDILLQGASDVDGDTLSVTRFLNVKGGHVSQDQNGSYQFIADADYNGVGGFDYEVSDGQGGVTMAHATIDILAVNDAPVGIGENWSMDEDQRIIFSASDLLANDKDVDLDILSVAAISNVKGGILEQQADGTYLFQADKDFNGTGGFDYDIIDGKGGITKTHVTIDIRPVNDAPILLDEEINIDEDQGLRFDLQQLLANDRDVDGDQLNILGFRNVTNGKIEQQEDGSYIFVPDANFFGEAGFEYEVSDGQGGISIGHGNLHIRSINDAPTTNGEYLEMNEDSIASFSPSALLQNDRDADGDSLSVGQVLNATNGRVWINAAGNIRFAPDSNYNGVAGFDYEILDGKGGKSIAHVDILVKSVNDAPIVAGEYMEIAEEAKLTFTPSDLLSNDYDVDGDSISISQVLNAAGGRVWINAAGNVRFVADTDYNGAGGFDYEVSDGQGGTKIGHVSLLIKPVNDTPAVQGDYWVMNEDTRATITPSQLLLNDKDADGNILAISKVLNATNGTVWINAAGNIRFLPDTDFNGVAGFDYEVSDGQGGTKIGHVTIQVNAVNDAPLAVGEVTFIDEDTGLAFTPAQLLANDSDVDNDALSLGQWSNVTGGALSWGSDGKIYFTPTTNFNGQAGFDYQVLDGHGGVSLAHVDIQVRSVNDAPLIANESLTVDEDTILLFDVAQLLGNDWDVDGDALIMNWIGGESNGTLEWIDATHFRFKPNQDFNGQASFRYNVTDGQGGNASGMVNIVLNPVNDAPIARNESVSVNEDNGLVLQVADLLKNDIDPDNDVLSLTQVMNARNGTVTLTANGQIIFSPKANYYGQAGFDYQVSDGKGGVVTAHVDITVNSINDAPWVTGYEKGWFRGADIEGGRLRFFVAQGPKYGKLEIDETGEVNLFSQWRDHPVDYFVIGVLDSSGAVGYSTFYIPARSGGGGVGDGDGGPIGSGDRPPPVVLDLDGDGALSLTSALQSGVSYDFDGDGKTEHTGWVGASDGFLIIDLGSDGKVTEAREFVFTQWAAGAKTDMEAVALIFDSDKNGRLDQQDARFSEFAIWQDLNQDGQSQSGEVRSLKDWGISSIDLHSNGQAYQIGGNVVTGSSSYTKEDGSVHLAGDVVLSSVPAGIILDPAAGQNGYQAV